MSLFDALLVLVLCSMSLISANKIHQRYSTINKKLQFRQLKDRTNRLTRRETIHADSVKLVSGNKPNELFRTISVASQHQFIGDRSTVWPRPIRLHGATETGHSTQPGRVSSEVDLVTTYNEKELPLAAINRLHLHHQSPNGHSDGNLMGKHSKAASQGNIPKPLDGTQPKTARSRLSLNHIKIIRSKNYFSFILARNKRDFSKQNTRTLSFNSITPVRKYKNDNNRKSSSTIQKENSLQQTGRAKTFIEFMGTSTTSSYGENGFNKDWQQSSNLNESTYAYQHIHADSWSERLLATKGLSSDQFAVSGRDDLSSFPDRQNLKGDSNYFHNVQRSGPHSASIRVQATPLIGDNKLSREYFTRKKKLYDDKIYTDKTSSMKNHSNSTLQAVFSDNRHKSEQSESEDSFLSNRVPFYKKNNLIDDVGKDKDFVIQFDSIDQKTAWPVKLTTSKNIVSNQNTFNESEYFHCITKLKNRTRIASRKGHNNKMRIFRRRTKFRILKVRDLRSREQRVNVQSRRKLRNEQIVKLTGIPSKKVIAGQKYVPWETWSSLTRTGHVQNIETKVSLDKNKKSKKKFVKISPSFSEDKRTRMVMSTGTDLVNRKAIFRTGGLQSTTVRKFDHPEKSPDVSASYRHNARLAREKRATIRGLSYAFVYGPKITSLINKSKENVKNQNLDHRSKTTKEIISNVRRKKINLTKKYIAGTNSKRKYTDKLVTWVQNRRLHLAFINRLNKEMAEKSTSGQIPFKQDAHLRIASDGKMDSISEAYVERSNERSADNRTRHLEDKKSHGSDSLMADISVNKEVEKLPEIHSSDGQYVNSTSLWTDTNENSHVIGKPIDDQPLYSDNEEKDKSKVISIISKSSVSFDDNKVENIPSSSEVILCRSMKDKALCPTLSPLNDPYVQTLDSGLLEGFSSYTELFHIEDEPIKKHVSIGSEKPVTDKPFTQTFESHSATEYLDESHQSHLRRRRSESLTSEMPEYEVRPTLASASETTISAISTQENYFSTTSSGTFHHKKISLIRVNKPSLDLTHIMYLPSSDTSHARGSQLVPWENKDFDEQGRPIIKIGVILVAKSQSLFSLNKSRSAIELAGEEIISPTGSLPGYTIQLVFRDSACSEVFGPLAGIDLYMLNLANVYIGPSCDYALAPLARFTPYWGKGIPVLTAGGLVGAFADKKTFQLLTRMQASHTKTSAFLMSILLTLGWSTFGSVFYDVSFSSRRPRSDCYFIITEIITNLEPVLKHKPWFYRFDEKRMENDTLDKAMAEIKNNARIQLPASPTRSGLLATQVYTSCNPGLDFLQLYVNENLFF